MPDQQNGHVYYCRAATTPRPAGIAKDKLPIGIPPYYSCPCSGFICL